MKDFFIFGIVLQLTAVTLAQRVAPGVNPQHYQQNQQYQQQPPQANPQYQQQQQYQQPPQHQQQPPQHQQQQQQQQQQQHQQQQQQQQVHHQQQQGQAHGHGHGHGHGAPVLSGNVQEEKEHIQEHMEVPMDTSKMSEQELQFHYFKMHDADNNNKLDGCELIKSLIHWHEQGSKEQHNTQQPNVEEKVFTDDELVSLIDPILSMDDSTQDGFIDYPEFVRAQEKSQANQRQEQRQQH
ncbi:G-box-binding factor isoform X4 [Bradysia coprophila]|uniref:G-box-binding factor isoform X4 n=1 Tax=Bradysia coprophila TaxID=38358 RepID=UPI00187D73EB|nr:G-box-binding factor isoform X4 [Bradysia coprophila]